MKAVFLDVGPLIALANPSDQYHLPATRTFRELASNHRMVTSDYVLSETLTNLARDHLTTKAIQFIQKIMTSRMYRVVYGDASVFATSLDIMQKLSNRSISCGDASTMAFVRMNKISKIFTFDSDFKHAGFEVVP